MNCEIKKKVHDCAATAAVFLSVLPDAMVTSACGQVFNDAGFAGTRRALQEEDTG